MESAKEENWNYAYLSDKWKWETEKDLKLLDDFKPADLLLSFIFFSINSYEMKSEFKGVKILFLQKDYKVCEKYSKIGCNLKFISNYRNKFRITG